MNVFRIEEERRQHIVQALLYSYLSKDLSAKINFHIEVRTPQVLLQGPVFVGLRKHTVLPSDKTLASLRNFSYRGYKVLTATRGEVNGPGVHFTLHRPPLVA